MINVSEDTIILTREGYDRVKTEMHHLSAVERPEVRKRLGEAKQSPEDFDTSEYENAKMDQAIVEGRIAELEDILRRARVLSDDEISDKEVSLGSTVRLKDLDAGDAWEVRLVSSFEADPSENRISVDSPLGEALLGHRAKQDVQFRAPAGTVRYRIMRITK